MSNLLDEVTSVRRRVYKLRAIAVLYWIAMAVVFFVLECNLHKEWAQKYFMILFHKVLQFLN